LQSQVFELLFGELEHEVFGEAVEVAAYGQVEVAGRHLVELGEIGEIGVQHDLLAADEVDPAFDQFDGDRQLDGRRWRSFLRHSDSGLNCSVSEA
jgi:hypothetical protein